MPRFASFSISLREDAAARSLLQHAESENSGRHSGALPSDQVKWMFKTILF